MRVLIATGLEELDGSISGELSSRNIEVAGECYYREGLLSLTKDRGADVVVLSLHLPGQADTVDLVKELRMAGLRVILLPGRRDDKKAVDLARRAVALGVYDIVWDPVSPETVTYRVLNPATLADAGLEPDEAAVGEVEVQGVSGGARREKKDITGLARTILRFLGKSRTSEATICDSEGQIEEAQFQAGRREEELDRKEIDEEYEENACGEGRCELPSSVSEFKDDVPDAFYRDALTGCFTRRYLLERFSPTGFYTVVFIDLDNFKPVNDILGHEMGDGVLAAFGKMLVENLKGRDLAVRWGGDEFVLILPGTARADAEKVVENLRREWKHCAPDTGNLEVGFSTGISEGARDLQATIKEADRLMYAEKRSRKVKEAWEKSHPRELYTPLSTRPARVDWATLKQAVSLAFSITAVVVLVSAVVWGMDWTAQMFGAHAPVLHEAARVVEEFWRTVLAGVL
ncbi:diguanylate cyclase (GGDEF)-like protein [Desulfofundulus luciae]|uniref:Stage 0 sporulation protein A homolog n=1 Tax=Desulfofundulus luciae TaxID=74702 RepID=A0ABU0B4V3_9FIRM|nr:GGDEF domain-containing protein [Desulfofundulus luciae]MDQ0287741.1 diguanylate cyclase (GGDEF)-like protein [Desulfofundulus luciae]